MGKILELLDKHVRLDELPDDHPQREHFHAVVGDGEKHEKFRALLRKAGMNEDDIAEAMRLATGGGNATDRLPLAATRGGMGGRAADARLAFDAMFPEAARITVERRGTTVTAGRPAKGQLTASPKSFRAPQDRRRCGLSAAMITKHGAAAVHESGHAVVARLVGLQVVRAAARESGSGVRTRYQLGTAADAAATLEKLALVDLSGQAAESRRLRSVDWATDEANATERALLPVLRGRCGVVITMEQFQLQGDRLPAISADM